MGLQTLASMNLFESHRQQITAAEAPLADRLRPRTLEEFIGKEHILGQGQLHPCVKVLKKINLDSITID